MSVARSILSVTLRKTVNSLIKPPSLRRLSSASSNVICADLADVVIPKISVPELVYSKCEKYERLTAIVSTLSFANNAIADICFAKE